jgi:hypothetical protein
MKIDNQFLIGALLGVLGVSAWNLIHPKIVTKQLIPIFWKPGEDVKVSDSANSEKFGISLEVAGPALYLLDTGWPISRIVMSKQTADRLQIEQQFPKHSITTKTGKNVIVYGPVPITIPGMPQTTVHSPLEIGDTNLINPSLFLDKIDIIFAGNTVTFSEKNTFRMPNSIFVPFSKRDEGRVFFTCEVGNGRATTTIDTGATVSTTLNHEIANRLGVEHFPISNQSISKTRNHLIPVSFPGTSISFITKLSISAGHYDSATEWDVLISGADLLTAGFGFTIRDDSGYEFFQTGLSKKPRAPTSHIPSIEPMLSTRPMDLTRAILKQYPTLA